MTTNNMVNVGLSGSSGTGAFVGTISPSLSIPVLGVASATSINFGGSTLNTYAASTSWTPVFDFVTHGNLSVSYGTQVGNYIKIGRMVFIQWSMDFTPTYTTASGVAEITGLPFAAAENTIGALAGYTTAAIAAIQALFVNGSYYLAGGTSVLNIVDAKAGSTSTTCTTNTFATAVRICTSGSMVYMASS